jgi:ABC-type nitrate/sulfonate/bicarbonate transport system substrate-binding protein
MAPTTLRIALDWTPNTIHSGLYLAQSKGYYTKHNLSVELLPPDAQYSKTPARRLEAGEVDLAICPSESCIAYNEAGKLQLQAIYAILQRDASAITGTKLDSMRELGDGKKYGSYNARYEDSIVKAMIAHDGGDAEGVNIESSEGKLSMFDAVKAGRIDATWIFLPWEGVEAEDEGVETKTFKLADYDIPYGFSPVIVRNAGFSLSEEVLTAFVAAIRQGYQHAIDHPDDAADVLHGVVSPPRSRDFLQRSQASINEYYSDGNTLGFMNAAKWSDFLSWLRKQNLLQGPKEISESDLFTNDFTK